MNFKDFFILPEPTMMIDFAKANKNRVQKVLDKEWSFKKLNAEEWHQFVQNFNYDDSLEPFFWLVKQKICDKGTALALYWYLQPTVGRGGGDDRSRLLREIEQHYASGFYASERFSFDPREEFLTPNTRLGDIPEAMTLKTSGIDFGRVEVEFAFLRRPDEKERKTIDKKIRHAASIITLIHPEFEWSDPDQAVKAIVRSVEHWKSHDYGKIRIKDLSYLWLECVTQKYGWEWIVWDYETGKHDGVSNPSKNLTCLANTLIHHTIDGFQPTSLIVRLYDDLAKNDSSLFSEIYSGIGLLFETSHLSFREQAPG
jgi:hypothetical protein